MNRTNSGALSVIQMSFSRGTGGISMNCCENIEEIQSCKILKAINFTQLTSLAMNSLSLFCSPDHGHRTNMHVCSGALGCGSLQQDFGASILKCEWAIGVFHVIVNLVTHSKLYVLECLIQGNDVIIKNSLNFIGSSIVHFNFASHLLEIYCRWSWNWLICL